MTYIHIPCKIFPSANNSSSTEALRPNKLRKDFWVEMVCSAQDAAGYLRKYILQCSSLSVFLDNCFHKVLKSIGLSSIFTSGVVFITVCIQEKRKIRWFSWSHTKNKKQLTLSLLQKEKKTQNGERIYMGKMVTF